VPSIQQELPQFSQPSAWEMSRPMATMGFSSMGQASSAMPSFPSSGPPPYARSSQPTSNGMIFFDQAEGKAFRELGEKAPQPRDEVLPFQDGTAPAGASPMFHANPIAENNDASLAFQQMPGQGFPPAPLTTLPFSNGMSRPGAPGPLGFELRERERDSLPLGEQLHRPPSSWSSRPPTWYDGASDASLSARGANSMLQPVQLGGGLFGGSSDGFHAAIWRPADRVDNFPTDSFLDKVK